MTTLARWSTLLGYLLLFATILVWNIWISPPTQISRSVLLLLLLTPLLLPLRGLLRANAYTHAWASFVALFYFLLGMSSIAISAERNYGMVLTAASLLFFNGCIFYARFRSREIKAGVAQTK